MNKVFDTHSANQYSPHAREAKRIAAAAMGMQPKDVKGYSISRAIMRRMDGRFDGLEAEMDQEVRNRLGVEGSGVGSILIPTSALLSRDMTSAGASGSNYLVGTNNLGNSFIDLLRPHLVTVAAGVQVMPGLTGNVTIPKQTAASTAYWLSNEATAITESQPTLGQLSLTPKTVGAYVELSRHLLMQSNPAADQLVMGDLAKVLALAIDQAILAGSGSAGQPSGLQLAAGIGSFTGTSLGLAGLMDAIADVTGANANNGNLSWVTTPTVAALLAQRQKFSGTDTPLWDGNLNEGQMLGIRGFASQQMTAGAMYLGDFSQILLGEWGYLELAASNSEGSNFKSGIVGLRAFQTVDVGVRNGAAFTLATSIT
jgi:HK97 family phage major capsid protein